MKSTSSLSPRSKALVPSSELSAGTAHPDRTTKAARLYVSPRSRPLNQFEMETRGLSYLLKRDDCHNAALYMAATEMAALIQGPCNLIPAPDHYGDTSANLRLARAIAGFVAGDAWVYDLLTRTQEAPSACDRHRAGLPPLTVAEHHIIRRPGKPIPCRPTYIVDNVTTGGTTIRACRAALGFGSGLVFADAYHPHF